MTIFANGLRLAISAAVLAATLSGLAAPVALAQHDQYGGERRGYVQRGYDRRDRDWREPNRGREEWGRQPYGRYYYGDRSYAAPPVVYGPPPPPRGLNLLFNFR
jgi:hypothetical protein